MSFLSIFPIALTKPQEYENLMARPFRSGWGYLYWLLAALVLIFLLLDATPALYSLKKQVAEQTPLFLSQINTQYPPDLVISLQDGKWSMNQAGPVHFDFDAITAHMKSDGPDPLTHLFTIDPEATVEGYDSYHTLILVTASSVVFPRGQNGSLQVFPLQDIPNTTIDRDMVENRVERVEQLSHWIIPAFFFLMTLIVLIAGPLLGAFIWSVGLLIYLIPLSIVTLLLGRLFKRAIDYRGAYRFGLYALTFPLLAQAITSLLRYPLPRFSFSLIFIAVTLIIFSISKTEPQGAPA